MKKSLYMIILMFFLVQFAFTVEYKEVTEKGISLKWSVEGENLMMILSADTDGWIAVGFNPSRIMKDADFKLAYVKNGNAFVEDHFGTGLFVHKPDTSVGGSSDFKLINGREENGRTTVEFSIPLNSGDEFDKVLNKGDEVKVLLAYGSNDDLGRKHRFRTSVMIEL